MEKVVGAVILTTEKLSRTLFEEASIGADRLVRSVVTGLSKSKGNTCFVTIKDVYRNAVRWWDRLIRSYQNADAALKFEESKDISSKGRLPVWQERHLGKSWTVLEDPREWTMPSVEDMR